MSKIPFLQNKETIIGAGILFGALVIILIDVVFVVTSVIDVYGNKKPLTPTSQIDAAVFSEAVKIIEK